MKKNIRKIPKRILTHLDSIESSNIVAGCSLLADIDDVSSGKYKHLGVALDDKGNVSTPSEPVVPPRTAGKYSRRNVSGYTVIRKDLPKVNRYTHSVETPNWGDAATYGTHTIDFYRDVYQREHYAPTQFGIKVLSNDPVKKGKVLLAFEVDHVLNKESGTFLSDLLYDLNLLQESLGTTGVQSSDATWEDYQKTLSVDWEILPPGTKLEVIKEKLTGSSTQSNGDTDVTEDRYKFFQSLNPQNIVVGMSGKLRYFGALLSDNLVVFENIEYGNAIYVMYDEWNILSQKSRTELLTGKYGDFFDRVVHTSNWKQKVKDLIKNKG